MDTPLLEDRNYDRRILEQRAMLSTSRINASLKDTLYIMASYGDGHALYTAPHDRPLSTKLIAWAEPYHTQEGAIVCAHTPRLKVLKEDKALFHKRDLFQFFARTFPIVFYDSEFSKAQTFAHRYIEQCYEAALRHAEQQPQS